MPDVPADTVTVDGETETEKVPEDEATDPELEQPERPKPSSVRAMKQQRTPIWRRRRITHAARKRPRILKAAALVDGEEELLETFVVFAIACNFPLPRSELEQFVAPV